VAGRLARARVMLPKRLAQRGVVLSGGVLAFFRPTRVTILAGLPETFAPTFWIAAMARLLVGIRDGR
jgi:hypothetical protein